MKPAGSTKIIVDRIEGDLAVLVLYDDDRMRFNFPIDRLPDGVKDGDHLQLSFAKDEAGRESEKNRIDDLLRELKGR